MKTVTANPDAMFYSCKSQFEKKNRLFTLGNFRFSLVLARNKIATPYYPFFTPLSIKRSRPLTRGSIYSDHYFEKLVVEER